MTTKDYHSSDKTDNLFCQPNNDQYNNLNLNQNYQSFHSDKIQSKSAFTKSKKVQNYDFTDLNDLQAKKDLNSWNKSSKHLSSNFLNLNRESEEEQCDLKKSKSANNSTLSLHIAAYENSVEDKADSKSKSEKTALIKKWNNTKQGFIDSLSFAQNPFEFPRQQEEQSNPPEVMQFKASQRLRNPNKEHLNFDKKSDKVAPLQPNHRPKSVDIQPIHCALRDSTMNTNYDIELSSNDSDNDSDSNETFTGGEKSSKAKIKYLRFSPDALKYISVGHKFSAKNPTKFTSKGTSHNMCFKMIKSDSRLVKSMLYSYGFTQCSRKNANVNFIWANTHMNGTTLRTFHPWQRINHFPRSVSITKKDMLHQNLSTMKKCFGACYDFYPESFILPDEKEILDAHYADKETVPPLISKPASASRGRGIQIVTDLKQIESIEAHEKSKVVLSEYISNPYLVNGRKFDLRLYVTVISFQPLIVYMFNDGLARFAVDEYTDDDTDFTETFKHLTNYSLNKFSENFIKNNDPTQEDIGHKWTVSALLRHLSKEGIDTKLLMVRMEDIVIKTLLSIQHHVSAAIRSTGLGPNVCFELFGFDILIDNDLKPWLLEVNLSPSLACDAPLDSILKTRVLCDTLNLAMVPLLLDINGENVVAGDEENLNENNDNDAVSSASASSLPASRSSSPLVFTKRGKAPFRKSNSLERRKPYNPAARVKIYSNRLKLEKTRKGNFVRIFPRKDTFYLYKHMIEELDYRHEKQDMLLFKTMYGEDPETFEIAGDVDDYHKQLMDAKNYKRTSDLSSETAEFLQEALDEAAEYEAEKHPNGFRIYPKSLPRLHPYARRRTSSQVIADEVRRQARLESLIIKPLEQELLRVASSSSSTSKVLSDVKTAV